MITPEAHLLRGTKEISSKLQILSETLFLLGGVPRTIMTRVNKLEMLWLVYYKYLRTSLKKNFNDYTYWRNLDNFQLKTT
jgi:hypothetical protein